MFAHEKAAELLAYLFENKGEMDKYDNLELFSTYNDDEVQEILASMAEKLNFSLLYLGDYLYLIPKQDNQLFGFKTVDIKNKIHKKDARNPDVHLLKYIWIFILYKYYSGKNENPKQISRLYVKDLIEDLDDRFKKLEEKTDEELRTLEKKSRLNIAEIASIWRNKLLEDGDIISSSSRWGLVIKAFTFFEDHGLARVSKEEGVMETTRKLDNIMRYYYLDERRVQEINKIFEKLEQED